MRAIATQPAYQRIADELRRAIIDGTLPPGSRMTSVPELARTEGVSTRTVYEAMRMLINEGLVTSKPGSGNFVRARPAAIRMVRSWYREQRDGSPWRADMAAQGRVGSWTSHSEETTATPAVAARLAIEEGSAVMRTDYVFTADDEPTYLSRSWEPLALTAGTPVMFPEAGPYAGRGVAERMATIGHAATWAREELLPRPLTAREAGLLGLHPGIGVLVIERTYFEGDRPLETADIVVPPGYRPVYEIPIG